MGYLGNHLATVVTGAFAAVLTGLWPYFVDFAPILNFVFIMAVPITWFLALMCWLSQKSTDYVHKHGAAHHHAESSLAPTASPIITTTSGSTPDTQTLQITGIKQIQEELTAELGSIRETLKLKDNEIERLNQEIANLQTRVQIESLKTELTNLKILATKKTAEKS